MRQPPTGSTCRDGTRGVLITRVEPLSASFDAEHRSAARVLLEINRQPVDSVGRLPPHRRAPRGPATS